jgi:PTH1 family peptidyl-tRNA hydrolase
MKLIVGLGNVGAQYARTRHNSGFMVVDRLAELLSASPWKTEAKFKAELAEANLDGERVVLAKPHTFMNLSGEAAAAIARFYKINPHDIWVIHDDLDVNFGRLRLRRSGSTAGHNGLKSLVAHLGDGFQRIRFGISLNDRAQQSAEEYVLAPFNAAEREALPHLINAAARIVKEQIEQPEIDETTFEL